MSGEREDLILGYLDKIEGRLNRLGDHVRDLRLQMTRVEENLANLNRRFDRLEGRIDRIERRLDLVSEEGIE